MKRVVEPELLDQLPAEDPLALHSRDDLQRLNACMGNAPMLARQLRRIASDLAPQILDLGAGDGRFMWQVARRLPQSWRGTSLDLLDKQTAISPQACLGLEHLGWNVHHICADVNDWLRIAPGERWSITCANLFLHHFADDALRRLLRVISEKTIIFIALEPRHSSLALIASKMVGLLGCNSITRHDAVISVRAGFTGNAISELWPKNGHWVLEERRAGLFSHLFIARRREVALLPAVVPNA